MTREEAKNELAKEFHSDYSLSRDVFGMYEDSLITVDEIYDDFESRTCRNCKWYQDIEKSFKVCKLYDIAHGKDFGCNKFERITNEIP